MDSAGGECDGVGDGGGVVGAGGGDDDDVFGSVRARRVDLGRPCFRDHAAGYFDDAAHCRSGTVAADVSVRKDRRGIRRDLSAVLSIIRNSGVLFFLRYVFTNRGAA